MIFENEKHFLEDKKSKEKLMDFKLAFDNYLLNEKDKVSENEKGEKILKGYMVSYYHHYGLWCEPIIYNLDKDDIQVEYQKMFSNDKEIEKHKRLKNNNIAVVLENCCLLFANKEKHYEYFMEYNYSKGQHEKYLNDFKEEIIKNLYVQPLVKELEKLKEKPSIKQPKI